MSNNWNVERISRKGESYKWDGTNTDFILGFLARNSIIGETYRDGEYILIKQDGCVATSIKHGIWVLKGEDGVIRFYTDDQHKLMYRPIDDELERLRAFARERIAAGMNDPAVLVAAVMHGLLIPSASGFGCDLVESLKATA